MAMSEGRVLEVPSSETAGRIGSNSSTLRAQLLWASLFPLATFGLLLMMALSAALYQVTLDLVTQRNSAQVQVLANTLAQKLGVGIAPQLIDEATPPQVQLANALQTLSPVNGSSLYLVDLHGGLIAASDPGATGLPLSSSDFAQLSHNGVSAGRLLESAADRQEIVAAYAPLANVDMGLVLTEPWTAILSPAYTFEIVLAALLALGIGLSLVMLSVSVTRVTHPIAALAENATGAVPGSIFHPVPVPEHGAREVRSLIVAFNQMVIRLAEQQTNLRQYAHKALLSQEEERQRISHELHDGTLQDLVGLAQRVELCRNELERDPQAARQRLEELQRLLGQTLDDVRRISNGLRPPVLEDLGLSIALDALCKDLQQDKPALRCEYTVTGQAQRLNPDLELAVYRVVQEALANIRKHARRATYVQVELAFGDTDVRATVKNDGAAFINRDVRASLRSGHLGLAGMYERARLFGGTLDITSDANEDTVVTLTLPCSPPEEK
jgi:two-component system, NarL family, sensor histidine kinase UhpB